MATSRQSERLIDAGGEDARDARVVSARMGETVGGVLYCAMPECRTWRPLAEFHGGRQDQMSERYCCRHTRYVAGQGCRPTSRGIRVDVTSS